MAIEHSLARLDSEGLVRQAARPFPRELIENSPPNLDKSALEALIEDRREGR